MNLEFPQFGRLESSGEAMRRIEVVADAIRDACGQSDVIPFDPFFCAEHFGISVQRGSFARSGIGGSVLTYASKTCITIAASDSRLRQRFTLCHELAHLCFVEGELALPAERFDASVVSRLERREERFCNQLAAELLMPRKSVARALGDNRAALACLQSLASHFDVSLHAALNRLRELRLWSVAQERWRYEGGPNRQIRRLGPPASCVVRRRVRAKGDRQRVVSQLRSSLRDARERLLQDVLEGGGLAARIANGRYVVLCAGATFAADAADSPEVFVTTREGGRLAAFAVQ